MRSRHTGKRIKHGMRYAPIYAIWTNMVSRCRNKNYREYRYYGGKGIDVCHRWLLFMNFFADMGHRPEGKTLDRIDSNKNYSPDNCRWATLIEQASNRSNCLLVSYMGKTLTIAEWGRHFGIKSGTLRKRFHDGIKPPELFTIKHRWYNNSLIYQAK